VGAPGEDATMTKTSREVFVEASAEEAAGLASRFVKEVISEAVQQRGTGYVALSGGTTPHGLYLRLAADGITGGVPWQDVEVFFGDEHDVPQDHAESNYRMAQRTLLDHVPIDLKRVHPMPADADDLQAAAAAYEQTIRRIVPADAHDVPRFDLILLGMGGEGHTASLFPGTEALQEQSRLVVSCFVPVLGRSRMTLTYPLINAARCVILFVTGRDKAGVVACLLGDDEAARRRLPASGVAPTDGRMIVILDSAAARAADLQP
jgi:6-phosphogluconolactonase